MVFSFSADERSKFEFIAEIGLNHNGSVETAKTMVSAAAESGATIVKFQTYKALERVKPSHPLYSFLESCEFSLAEWEIIVEECARQGVSFLSTAFGLDSLNLLENLGQTSAKIASFSMTDSVLIESAASKAFSLIISTGASSWSEVVECRDRANELGLDHVFFHCISTYPVTSETGLHLSNLGRLRSISHRRVGFSDHSLGPEAVFYAALAGATLFEKHFTTDNSLGGPDQEMSANPDVFLRTVQAGQRAHEILGEWREDMFKGEEEIVQYRTKS
jgi:sialic acid synthase SpsE